MEIKVMTATRTAGGEVTAADTSQAVNVFTTTPNIYILALFARVKTAFAGVTLPEVSLGIAGDTGKYIPKQPINAETDLVVGKMPQAGPDYCAKMLSYQKTPENIPIIATFSSASGNLSSLSAGEIEFVCVYVE